MSAPEHSKIAYINARLIDPASGFDETGALLTDGNLIADFGPRLAADNLPQEALTIDCKGMCLAPGLVDMRAQLGEPGFEHKETISSGSQSAAAGGITSLACLPNTNPPIDSVALVGFIERRGREAGMVNIYPYASITQGIRGDEITEMGLLSASGAIAFTDGLQAVGNPKVMSRALSYAKSFDLLLVQHPEDPVLAEGGVMNSGEISSRLGLGGISNVAEVILLERDIRLLETTGGRYHAAHISTALSVEVIRRAKERGLDITCDTAPFYFALNELAVGDYRTFARLSPPLRSEADREAIVEGLKDGTIDAIASDHAPHDEDSKRQPFAQAEAGAVGFETLLAVSLELYHNKTMSLPDLLKALTASPAEILGLPAGHLKAGAPADIILFDPDAPWQVKADDFISKSKNSPFDDRPVQGRVARTVVGGVPVYVAPDLDKKG